MTRAVTLTVYLPMDEDLAVNIIKAIQGVAPDSAYMTSKTFNGNKAEESLYCRDIVETQGKVLMVGGR